MSLKSGKFRELLKIQKLQGDPMYPLCFNEFLKANGEIALLKMVRNANPAESLASVIHQKLLTYFKRFLIIGGYARSRK